jgi:hypothetical protein
MNLPLLLRRLWFVAEDAFAQIGQRLAHRMDNQIAEIATICGRKLNQLVTQIIGPADRARRMGHSAGLCAFVHSDSVIQRSFRRKEGSMQARS